MVASSTARTGAGGQTLVVDLAYPPDPGRAPFTRADLVVTGVDHSGTSYEVRLYLDNPGADIDTPRDPEAGYAGRYTVFGHGGCYGDEGHCEVPEAAGDPTDVRPVHQLTPLDTFVTVTDALRRVLDRDGRLSTVTMVPVSLTPRRSDRSPAPELLEFADLSLHTYLAATDLDVPTPG
ncbi:MULTISPECIES: hypothetical protein [unclassified Pseudonocardia]|uniref:hypothetical protein n=1 Tax=unclassified Pseudonocardia TaxID=2619320 RepID=UPI00095AF481|nr:MULTISPECIES: hypothetical protein [unclassified Pseudonocardia]MBN9097722.1 hypothetical protein [Pseudonocardia sp.]OJY40014.1 MAG: hypothetical protein BGP03_22455 [Pseudonocardia sp. 73-21]